ncbi:Gfo/Idh/MocA family protein [Thermodesulfatator atlanticus]|uniref:Gfo/Idh/MocA family protein n=1 Tax=Thermodesulfatator atlanticus TaxID=501497 RepID=UPI0003B4E595|nr:Gfo/Idh/MocA family oxidoreductase [Thermodesulfatator atlanticus]
MSKVRIAVIGVGHLGRFHAQKLAKLPEAELVGVVDVLRERANAVAKECNTKAFYDYQEVLPLVDAVSIVVPTVYHFEVAKAALYAGCHVFVEKPLASTPEEARKLVSLAKELGLILQVGHIERFNPAIKKLLSKVKNPRFIEAHRVSKYSARCLDVDVILDLMIHDIDLMLTIVGDEIKELQAAGAPVITDKIDLASVRIHFKNGMVANLTASRIALKPARSFRVYQEGAYLAADTLESTFTYVELSKTNNGQLPDPEKFPNPDPLFEEICAFIEAVKTGKHPPVSGEDGFEALELAFRIKKEIEKQKAHFLAREGSCLPDLIRHCMSS